MNAKESLAYCSENIVEVFPSFPFFSCSLNQNLLALVFHLTALTCLHAFKNTKPPHIPLMYLYACHKKVRINIQLHSVRAHELIISHPAPDTSDVFGTPVWNEKQPIGRPLILGFEGMCDGGAPGSVADPQEQRCTRLAKDSSQTQRDSCYVLLYTEKHPGQYGQKISLDISI